MAQFIQSLANLSDVWIYAAIFFIAYIENIFPPSPSDMVVVFGGSLAGLGQVHLLGALAAATLGSTLGFSTMFGIGRWFGVKIVESGRLSFLPREGIDKVEGWFRRYGYGIIIANRFLAGTRAVISFFAGMSHLRFIYTLILSFVSALLWNTILILAGNYLGKNWENIGVYLTTYSQTVTALIIIAALFFIGRYFYRRSKAKSS